MLNLQRTAGNRAVVQLLFQGGQAAVLQRDGPATAMAPASAAAATTPADPDDIAWIDGLSANDLQAQIDTQTWAKAKEASEETGITSSGDAAVAAYTLAQQRKIAKLTKAKQVDKAAAAAEEMKTRVAAMGASTKAKVDAAKAKYLTQRQKNRRQFMVTMREWLGSDDNIKNHFTNIVAVPQNTGDAAYLYQPAAERLTAVQEIISNRNLTPPSVGNSQDLRERHLGHYYKGYMGHPMGLSVDYNAYSNPKISDDKLYELIRLVTAGTKAEKSEVPSRLNLPGDSRATVKEMGEATKAGDQALVAGKGDATAADVDLSQTDKYKAFFDAFNEQFDRMVAGSKTLQTDLAAESITLLQTTKLRYIQVLSSLPKLQAELEGISGNLKTAAEVDKPALLEQQQRLQAERSQLGDELEKMPAVLATVFKPWLDKVAERTRIVKEQADKDGLDPENLPSRKILNQIDSAVERLAQAEAGAKKESTRKKPNLAPWTAKIASGKDKLTELAGEALRADTTAWTSVEWKFALKTLWRWNTTGLSDEYWALLRLQTSLTDVSYVFGQVTDVGGKRRGAINDALSTLAGERNSDTLSAMAVGQQQGIEEPVIYGSKYVDKGDAKHPVTYGTAKRVLDPSPMQLIEMGYFNPTDTFSKAFFEIMMEHGFQPGAAWSPGSTDPMHFDYVAGFDDIAEGSFGPSH